MGCTMQPMPQLLVAQDSQLSARWDSFLQEDCKVRIQQAALEWPEVRSVVVQFNEIQLRDPDLANYLLQRPQQAFRVGNAILQQIDVTVEPKPRLVLRITGLPESQKHKVRELRAEHLGRLMAIEGLVKKVTEVR